MEDLSTKWRMLGRRLGLSEGVLGNIDSENRYVKEKGVEMFDEWKARNLKDATGQALIHGLNKIGKCNLSEKVERYYETA